MAGSERSPPKHSAEEWLARAALASCFAWLFTHAAIAEAPLLRYEVVGDAIPEPLSGAVGDPARGRVIVVNRRTGLCLLCHSGPFAEERLQGTLAPDLAGVGSRYSAGQLRLRIVDASRVNPQTIMPLYYRIGGLQRVANPNIGKPILTADQIEDVVAFLTTLKAEQARGSQ